jgi:predicted O-methyltransferase YrrM
MPLTPHVKNFLNGALAPFNARVESRTAGRIEAARLATLDRSGHFSRPMFPVLPQFLACDPAPVLAAVTSFREATERFSTPRDSEYCYLNDYFSSPDAEVAYALVRSLHPRRLIEVGSGNSTLLFRAAIRDGGLNTELVSIDPAPRTTIEHAADRVVKRRLEQLPSVEIIDALSANDILFIDSSHDVRIGSDVVELFLKILPSLKEGVVVHVHDIFLPFEYPRDWIIENKWTWNEQYLVQGILQDSDRFEVLWPGHYLQRTLFGFADHFNSAFVGTAASLWLRKVRQ